jgi:large subunit ribosomal protein L7Ae
MPPKSKASSAAAPAPKAAAAPSAPSGAASKKQSSAKAAKAAATAAAAAKGPVENPLYPARKKNFRIGNDVQHKRDLTRFVKWPRYVRVQRQRKVLYERLKVPPAIAQFHKPLDRSEAAPLFKLLDKYKPETKKEKEARIAKEAEDKVAGKVVKKLTSGLNEVKFGLNHVTTLVEEKKAKLVIIASDVDPIELVVWLPTLCRKLGIPYVIVNNKGVLGKFVHQKKAAALALVNIKSEDLSAFERIVDVANAKFALNVAGQKRWGGGVMGLKTQKRLEKRAKQLAIEQAKRSQL